MPIRNQKWRVSGQSMVSGSACTDIGRHTPFKGAATLDQGIVVDLARLPSAGLSRDGKTMTVSPARKWDDLYEELDPLNLTVIGGRVAGVGVGGLVLGCESPLHNFAQRRNKRMLTLIHVGGISYLSARHGFACDHVVNFEVSTPWNLLRNVCSTDAGCSVYR
jgi:FAD/FMN-containing dehydrogenase